MAKKLTKKEVGGPMINNAANAVGSKDKFAFRKLKADKKELKDIKVKDTSMPKMTFKKAGGAKMSSYKKGGSTKKK